MTTAVLAGATGLVGSECLNQLLQDPAYERIHALTRRPLAREHPKLSAHIVDFEALEAHPQALRGDDIFICLGTTLKKAGSRDAFKRVDHDYALAVARAARHQGAARLLLVTAIGANARSPFFYNRVKGELEHAVAQLGYPEVHCLRPSILLGERDEARPLEDAGQRLLQGVSAAMRGPLGKYRPIEASTVARALRGYAQADTPGFHAHDSDALQAYAGRGAH